MGSEIYVESWFVIPKRPTTCYRFNMKLLQLAILNTINYQNSTAPLKIDWNPLSLLNNVMLYPHSSCYILTFTMLMTMHHILLQKLTPRLKLPNTLS